MKKQIREQVKIIEKVVEYIAEDGKVFGNAEDCEEYEKVLRNKQLYEEIKELRLKSLDGVMPIDDEGAYSNYSNYQWYILKSKTQFEKLNDFYGELTEPKSYPTYICIESEYDYEVDLKLGDVYTTELKSLIEKTKDYFAQFGLKANFTNEERTGLDDFVNGKYLLRIHSQQQLEMIRAILEKAEVEMDVNSVIDYSHKYPYLTYSRGTLQAKSMEYPYFENQLKDFDYWWDFCVEEKSQTIISHNEKIQLIAYELYKQHWLDTHTTREMRLDDIRNWAEVEMDDESESLSCSYDECNQEFGFAGELYACYDEFLDNEYQDEETMKNLLSSKTLINAYLKSIK